jgi:hypothetical protein
MSKEPKADLDVAEAELEHALWLARSLYRGPERGARRRTKEDRRMSSKLQVAMARALEAELDTAGGDYDREPEPEPPVPVELESDRQRNADAALADAVEIVARHRRRLGRRHCSHHDGATIRKIWELLRGLAEGPEQEGGFGP